MNKIKTNLYWPILMNQIDQVFERSDFKQGKIYLHVIKIRKIHKQMQKTRSIIKIFGKEKIQFSSKRKQTGQRLSFKWARDATLVVNSPLSKVEASFLILIHFTIWWPLQARFLKKGNRSRHRVISKMKVGFVLLLKLQN